MGQLNHNPNSQVILQELLVDPYPQPCLDHQGFASLTSNLAKIRWFLDFLKQQTWPKSVGWNQKTAVCWVLMLKTWKSAGLIQVRCLILFRSCVFGHLSNHKHWWKRKIIDSLAKGIVQKTDQTMETYPLSLANNPVIQLSDPVVHAVQI